MMLIILWERMKGNAENQHVRIGGIVVFVFRS